MKNIEELKHLLDILSKEVVETIDGLNEETRRQRAEIKKLKESTSVASAISLDDMKAATKEREDDMALMDCAVEKDMMDNQRSFTELGIVFSKAMYDRLAVESAVQGKVSAVSVKRKTKNEVHFFHKDVWAEVLS